MDNPCFSKLVTEVGMGKAKHPFVRMYRETPDKTNIAV